MTTPYATRMRVNIKYINRAADSVFDTARPCVIQGLVGVRQHQVPTRHTVLRLNINVIKQINRIQNSSHSEH